MANDLTKNPLIIDTPGAGVLWADRFHARGVRWVAPAAAAGNLATITDKNGRVVWTSVASGANYVESDVIEWKITDAGWDGIIVPVLASGVLYIEYL